MISDILFRLLLGVIVFVVIPTVSLFPTVIAIIYWEENEYMNCALTTMAAIISWLFAAVLISLFLGV